jgi:hypothetical protein
MKKETLEEAAKQYAKQYALSTRHISHIGFEDGAKWQAERMYSEEEVYNLLCQFPNEEELDNWFEQNKKK